MLKDPINVLGFAYGNTDTSNFMHTLGNKRYELSNHLGNVLTVISDKPIPHNNGGTVDYFMADIKSAQDYSPFGVTLSGRDFNSSESRYSFQGQEHDDEVKGKGNSVNYTFRMHDTRLARFFAVDPLFKDYPHYTPYSFSGNKVIHAVELEGLEEYVLSSTKSGSNLSFALTSLFRLLDSKTQEDIMFVSPGSADGLANTITRPLTKSELETLNPRNERNAPKDGKTGTAKGNFISSVISNQEGNFIKRSTSGPIGGVHSGESVNPTLSPPNTTSTNINGNFGGSTSSDKIFNVNLARGSKTLNITYDDGGSYKNRFSFFDAATGSPIPKGVLDSGSGKITLSIPAGVNSITIKINGIANNVADNFSINIISSGPTESASDVPGINNVNGQTTTPIKVEKDVSSSAEKPLNN